jgi:hypothetical protein
VSLPRFKLTAPPPPSEAYVQSSIIDYLRARNIPYSITDAAPKACPRCRSLVASKVMPGWPDLTACYAGRFVGLEVKAKRGRVSKDTQAPMHDYIRRAGGLILVPRSAAEVDDALKGL